MARSILLSLSLIITCLASVSCQRTEPNPLETAQEDGWHHYGITELTTGQPVTLTSLKGDETNVILTGRIKQVCPKKGCWMQVTDGTNEQFVRFQNYAFFVPMNADGHDFALRGRAEMQTVSVEDLQHQAEDAGKSALEIAAITEPETYVVFFADSVYIKGDGLDEPYKPGDEIEQSEDGCEEEGEHDHSEEQDHDEDSETEGDNHS